MITDQALATELDWLNDFVMYQDYVGTGTTKSGEIDHAEAREHELALVAGIQRMQTQIDELLAALKPFVFLSNLDKDKPRGDSTMIAVHIVRDAATVYKKNAPKE